MMDLAPAIGLLIVAAITPGPNNVFVMTAAMQGDIFATVKTILAIIVGSLILFALVNFGLDTIHQRVPLFRPVVGLLGSTYLGWLGFSLMRLGKEEPSTVGNATQPSDLGLILFQLLNPKGWVLMSMFLVASGQAQAVILLPVLIVVMASCLTIWAFAGVALSKLYGIQHGRLWIDRVMGVSLVIFSALLAQQSLYIG